MARTIAIIALGAALAGAVAAPVAATAAGSSPAQVGAAHRRLAVQDATDLVKGATLPPGSRRAIHGLPNVPFSVDAAVYADEVDRHALWTTTAAPARALAAVTAGMAPRGTRRLDVVSGAREASATFSLPNPGASIVGRLIVGLDAVRRPGGVTAVRIDALVRYRAPRLPSQLIPSAARVMQVTRRSAGRPPAVDLTVRGAGVQQVAQLIDALPIAAPVHGRLVCPFIPASQIDTFVFRATADGPVLARLTAASDTPTSASPCSTIPLALPGHRSLNLLEVGRMLHGASSILGVPLVAHPHGFAGQSIS
jgi:hypothetical protein